MENIYLLVMENIYLLGGGGTRTLSGMCIVVLRSFTSPRCLSMTSYTETWPPSGLVRHLGCVCRLSRSLFVPGRHLKKGGRLPSPPLLAPTPGWPPRGGLVSAPQLPTPRWPLRERRETPPR